VPEINWPTVALDLWAGNLFKQTNAATLLPKLNRTLVGFAFLLAFLSRSQAAPPQLSDVFVGGQEGYPRIVSPRSSRRRVGPCSRFAKLAPVSATMPKMTS